jgi:hypothetical protein
VTGRTTRRFAFEKRGQLLVGTHNEALPIAAIVAAGGIETASATNLRLKFQ